MPRSPDFSMQLVRERVGARVPRSALLDSSITDFRSRAEEPRPSTISPPAPEAKARRAAVALIIRPAGPHGDGDPEILFIRRAEHPQDPWSGHMAFPGGREEPSDGDLLQTALRETLEEVSLDLASHARLLGRLDELPAVARGRRTGLTIAPFVFELTDPVELTLNGEVAEVVWAPLEPLFEGALSTTFPYDIAGQHLELPAHDVAGRVVWGLTHRMLESLFALLR